MSKFPLALFGMVCAVTWGAGRGVARAEADEPPLLPDSAGPGAAVATTQVTATAPKKRAAQNLQRHLRLSGGYVPEERLRRSPLARPSGHLHLIFPGVKDEVEINLYNDDGSYNSDALERASHLLRCRRTATERPIAPQLLMLLSHVEDHFDGKPLEIVSGYRNQRKTTSNHFKGTATDIRIAGVAPRKVREFAETLDGGGMGIGLYPRSGFVHIDVRSSPSYRWVDYSPPGSNEAEKRPPIGWKRKKLQS